MLTPQIRSMAHLSRIVMGRCLASWSMGLFISQPTAKSAVLLSIPDYEKLLADAEEGKRLKRLAKRYKKILKTCAMALSPKDNNALASQRKFT